ncbi:acetyl-CoA synthetase-like protein [Lojkania enalia]|uniref:Acetyl-CoA synthetase-like protein n=1 Tax=Lojkania enalia TaxID=147567 RepID=A0A9P4MW31_9PLEO|nr:acetyl-CoA synthetase-like protein [Didymosphaeria enalia]
MAELYDTGRRDALQRLNQTLLQIDPYILPPYPNLSIVSGPLDPPLLTITLSQLLEQQASLHPWRECLVIPWTGARWTYQKLWEQSNLLARALLKHGTRPKDRIGIMAGNCEQYVAVFFACAKVGAVCVTLNNTYTVREVENALKHTKCKLLFTTRTIGRFDNSPLLVSLQEQEAAMPIPDLKTVCLLRGKFEGFVTYSEFLNQGCTIPEQLLDIFDSITSPHDVVNLQFTSGSTGNPKAAMLTHHNLINNSRFIGDRMNLTHTDILCCPPPLFHCFGLTLGLLAILTHGGKIVYPGESFDPIACLNAISEERCTALHGVPAMIESIINLERPNNWTSELRTGIVAGSPVPRWLMERMVNELGMTEFTSSYGLTEASPTVFNAHTTDSLHARLTTVGTIMPHARAKIVDHNGRIVPIGVRGELCVTGYQLCRGYWENPEKTNDVLVRDEQGELWLKTGDEAVIDVDGYCTITGRFKDIIIRGGENIYPLEIEERLVEHPFISRAIVVGISHPRYVEVPVSFLQLEGGSQKPSLNEVRSWVRKVLGRHKAPMHVFWLGEDCSADVPLTGSGKIKKFMLREVAERLIATQ